MNARERYIKKLENRKVILFGAGNYAKQFFMEFQNRFCIAFCISNNSSENVLLVDGKEMLPVYRVEEGLQMMGEDAFIVLCSVYFQDMAEQLEHLGYSCGIDYLYFGYLKSIISQKKIAVVYGVCYMRAIHTCLKQSESFNEDYEINYWLSYLEMNVLEYHFFIFMLTICDLYIYNTCMSQKERIKNEGFLAKLSSDCKKIRVPLIGEALYHPQSLRVGGGMNPYGVVSAKTHWGPFTAADWNINQYLEKGRTAAEILEIVSDETFYSKEWIEKNYFKQFRKIQIQEAEADIKISDYFLQKHGKERLMLDESHISNYVILELTKRILQFLGYNTNLSEKTLVTSQLIYTSEVPLYPAVIQGLSLDVYRGENVKYQLFSFQGDRQVTFEEYVSLYCEFCGDMLRYMQQGFFPA